MSRFVDRTRTRRVDLGPCECPGTPHESDYALVRAELSGQEIADYTTASNDEVADVSARLVPEWNLIDRSGAVPVTGQALVDLMPTTLAAIVNALSTTVGESVALPNASGAPSRATSQGSASRTRKTPTRR